MVLTGQVVLKLLGLSAAAMFMPALGAMGLGEPAYSPGAPEIVATPEARPTATLYVGFAYLDSSYSGGSYSHYDPSDLNGGSRGFPAASLTVNESVPALGGATRPQP